MMPVTEDAWNKIRSLASFHRYAAHRKSHQTDLWSPSFMGFPSKWAEKAFRSNINNHFPSITYNHENNSPYNVKESWNGSGLYPFHMFHKDSQGFLFLSSSSHTLWLSQHCYATGPGKQAMSWHKWATNILYHGNNPHPDKDGGKETSAMFVPERMRLGPTLLVGRRIKSNYLRGGQGSLKARWDHLVF